MTDKKNIHTLTLSDSLRLCDSGACTVAQIVNACYDRIDKRESQVGAWQHILPRDAYLQRLHTHKDFYRHSLLRGLPVAIKDIIDTAHMPTELGSDIHRGRQPVNDATCVQLLKQAGAIVMGKTVTTEFAYFRPGKTANPCNLTHTPGGSSSGSAAAVADCMVPVALGTQTAASMIRPAAYCGTLGYVATRGEISLRGIQPLAQSLDSLGVFARCVDDIQLVRRILLRHTPTAAAPENIKIVCVHGDAIGDCSADMHRAMDMATHHLADIGIQVVHGDFGDRIQQLVTLHSHIMAFEVARNMVEEADHPDVLSHQFTALLSEGLKISYKTYVQALRERDILDTWLRDMYGDADAFLTPAAPGAAPAGLDATGSPHMSRPWQLLGRPMVTYPVTKDDNGLPLSVQLVGNRHRDDRLLAILKTILS